MELEEVRRCYKELEDNSIGYHSVALFLFLILNFLTPSTLKPPMFIGCPGICSRILRLTINNNNSLSKQKTPGQMKLPGCYCEL